MDLCNDRVAPPQAAGMNPHFDPTGWRRRPRPVEERNAPRRDRLQGCASPGRRPSGRHAQRATRTEESDRTFPADRAAQHLAALAVDES